MPYRDVISVRMSGAMHAELVALAAKRETDVGKLIRELIAYELKIGRDRVREALGQLFFVAIAMDELLAAHRDETLRDHVIQQWRARMAEEAASDAE
jgi:hypothetical protein